MYKTHTTEEYRDYFGLPADYTINAMLVCGTFSLRREMPKAKAALDLTDREYEFKNVETSKEYGSSFPEGVKELHIGQKVIWYSVNYGGALLSEYLHLGYLFGAQKTVLVGMCGGLKPEAKSADIIIPTAAQADGSTAHMYDRTRQELQLSNSDLSDQLAAQCLADKLTVHRGKTMTCQAMLAETSEDVQQWSEAGYLGVEMEASTVFAVSNHFQKPSAAMLCIADNLIESHTTLSAEFQDMQDIRTCVTQSQYKIAVESLLA